ncbi:hypothetical protein KJD95_16205 [Escherichia marmotae]|nr:hypothetical protein [Escherichia coli]MDQ9210452.1 hypothetical protein [Escherichia marmotae]EIN9660468.1 hypothetical protein [Escherichia coli]MBC1061697.1 hypothetical protein [Escherichia coli]MDQ9285783.1 hypothetical protein [Escherichia marmotae]
MEAADIKKIKDLEDENRRLKQMFTDLSMECRALKDVIEKNFKTSDKAIPGSNAEAGEIFSTDIAPALKHVAACCSGSSLISVGLLLSSHRGRNPP